MRLSNSAPGAAPGDCSIGLRLVPAGSRLVRVERPPSLERVAHPHHWRRTRPAPGNADHSTGSGGRCVVTHAHFAVLGLCWAYAHRALLWRFCNFGPIPEKNDAGIGESRGGGCALISERKESWKGQ